MRSNSQSNLIPLSYSFLRCEMGIKAYLVHKIVGLRWSNIELGMGYTLDKWQLFIL